MTTDHPHDDLDGTVLKTPATACVLCTYPYYSYCQQEWTVSEMGNRRNLLITGHCSNIKGFLLFQEHRCCRLIDLQSSNLASKHYYSCILIDCNSLSKSITVKSCYWSASLETILTQVPFTCFLSRKAQVLADENMPTLPRLGYNVN